MMHIFTAGNVGIGTDDPVVLFELNVAAGTKMGISLGAVGDTSYRIKIHWYLQVC